MQQRKVVLAVVIVDQALKYFATEVELAVVLNRGVVFGWMPFTMWLVVIAVILGLMVKENNSYLGWWLVIGGGVSNLIDRIWHGGVVDYISLSFLPIFNLADAVIVVGVVLWLFREYKYNKDDDKV